LFIAKGGGLIREIASLVGNNLVVIYYLSASEIWPDKRVAFGKGTTVNYTSIL
jgi:hypothetical protein